LLTPFASALIVATMLVAIWTVHIDKGFFVSNGGYEYPLVNAAVALGVAFTGPGLISLDWLLRLPLGGAKWGFIALGLGLVGALPPVIARSVAAHGSAPS
jgi:putative oxidoreductase